MKMDAASTTPTHGAKTFLIDSINDDAGSTLLPPSGGAACCSIVLLFVM